MGIVRARREIPKGREGGDDVHVQLAARLAVL